MDYEAREYVFIHQLYPGESAEIALLKSEDNVVKRMRNMGLKEGCIIELLHYDPLISKKIVLKVENSTVALDSSLAQSILVKPVKSWYFFYKERAFTDDLTGCLNRNAGLQILKLEYERVSSEGASMSLILIDVDHFKTINDRFGHLVGDMVLKKLGQIFVKLVRRTDHVFRWGGEEFLILLRNIRVKEALLVAERIREVVRCESFEMLERGFISISAGVDGVPPYLEIDKVLERVDKALYRAKSSGRDRVITLNENYSIAWGKS